LICAPEMCETEDHWMIGLLLWPADLSALEKI
jgi:hypothetical protein